MVFLSVSSIYGQMAAVCGGKGCAELFPPAGLGLGMLLPQQHGGIRALAAGEWSCTQPLAEGSRKQEEEGNGVRRRDEVWV